MISDRADAPIRIAGAGPSGLAAAITLARAGRRVEVHEAKDDVGRRFIGDLQTIENASESEQVPDFLARIGIATNFYFRPATAARFFDERGKSYAIRSSTPYSYFIRRGAEEGTLDRGLLAQALDAGADVRFRSRLDPASADIVATGPAMPDGLAKEVTFSSPDADRVDVYFDHKTSPGGYSYLFVLDGVATFGCAIVSDFRNIDRYFDASFERAKALQPVTIEGDLRAGYSYMNFHLKETAVSGETRYVGEAAGFQDYLFGLGIRYALTSGWLAAQSILTGESYDSLWRPALATKQETSVVNRFLYERGGNFGLGMFARGASRTTDFRAYLSSWHRSTFWKRALLPLIRRTWRHDGRCLHRPALHWCRSRDTEMRVPPLGPIDQNEIG